ncbi:MAG TPA: hypothetical protein VKT28_18900 [Puia sp.]|nr:hypothetical protein [Puia sp.]
MRIKYILLFAVLVSLVIQSNAQYKRRGETLQTRGKKPGKSKKADYTIEQFKGKWQEFERRNRSDSSVVSFNDSIQLKFSDSSKVMTKTSIATSMTLVGDAEIGDNNLLTVAADEYTVKSLTTDKMVLDDDEKFIHILKKLDTFWYETLGRIPVKQLDYSTPISTSVNNILGKWFVYRRYAKPGATTDNVLLIKYLNLTAKSNETTAIGDITFYQGQSSQQLSCTATIKGSEIKIVAGSNKWTLSVYQADANNFVFGNADLLYFSKPSKGE